MVADNGSTDGSVEMLATHFPGIRTIVLDRNYGFTGGYNRAMARLLSGPGPRPEYLLLLNSDILVEPGWLDRLTDYMDTHPECGVCGPKLLALTHKDGAYIQTDRLEYAGAAGGYIDRFGYPFCRGRVLSRTDVDGPGYSSVKDVLWVSGACLMTRTTLWEESGGLDERFFAHMEEIDYCWRAQLAGHRVRVVPSSRVWHLGGGTLPRTSATKLRLNYRNGLLLLDNNLAPTIGRFKARVRIITRLVLDDCSALVYLLVGKTDFCGSVFRAHREYRRLRKVPHKAASRNGDVRGVAPVCIILQSLLRGERIFDYLRRYEDSH